jgi:tRNA(Arg) A34 adenosine deaminase TadA
MESDPGFQAALEEARQGFEEGGVPIGACLVAGDGTILGRGHNMRIQSSSAILHVRCHTASPEKLASDSRTREKPLL